MVTLSGTAVAIVAVIGYLGINSIVSWIGDQFKDKDDQNKK